MAEPQFGNVIHQLVRQFPVVHELAFRSAPPRAEMDFVDGHRLVQPVGAFAPIQPIPVTPGVSIGFGNEGGGAGTYFEMLAVGVGFQQDCAAVAVADFEFVQIARVQIGDEQFPHAAAAADPHGVNPAVPAVEVADHADPFGIGRPYGEQDARDAIGLMQVRAQEPVGVPVLALAE